MEASDISRDSQDISHVNLEGQQLESQPESQPQQPQPQVELSDAEYQKAFFERLNSTIEKLDAGGRLIVGIPPEKKRSKRDEEDEDEEDEKEREEEEKIYPKETINTLRYVIITKNREELLEKALKMVTCGQYNKSCMMFTTDKGNRAILGIARSINGAKRKKTPALRFDALLALTIAIEEFDHWVCDHELGGQDMELDTAMKNLGQYWSILLSHSDEELGIDSEFTRPGVEALLAKFKTGFDRRLVSSDCAPFTYNLNLPKPVVAGGKKRKATDAR